MNQYTTYGQFLNQSYRKILQACLEDEAIDTLKILQNKDYLLLRINQLFSEIYVAEREKMIQDQAVLISSLQQVQRSNVIEKVQKCFNCELMKEHISEMEHQIGQFQKKANQNQSAQEKSVKKIEGMLLKEIQGLKKDQKMLQEENIYKKMQFQEESTKIVQQNNRLKTYIKQQIEKRDKNEDKLKAKIKQIQQQKETLENQVFNYLQSRGKQEKDIRELNARYSNLSIVRERQQNQLNLIRNENNILEEKLKHLQEENLYLKEKNNLTQRQIKTLKKQMQQLNAQVQSQRLMKKQENGQNEFIQGNLSNENIQKRSQLQRKQLQSIKCIQLLKQELAQKQNQFSQITVQNQKTILKLNDQLRKVQIRLEKQLRNCKEQYKKTLLKNNQELEAQWKQEKQDLVRKHERIQAQKESLCQKLQEKIIILSRNLTQSEQFSNQSLKQFESQKNRLAKQIEKQKHNYNELKRYHSTQKISEQILQKENYDKFKQLSQEKNQLAKLLAVKEKEIREYKKEISKSNEQTTSLQLKIDDLKNKNSSINQAVDQQIQKCKAISQKLKEKSKQCQQFQERFAQLIEQVQQSDKKISALTVNQKRLQQKIRRYESEMAQKRQLLLSMHQSNQQQVIDVFAKAQQSTVEARKQLQNYYMNLLKTNQQKTTNAMIYQLQKLQQEELEKLRQKNFDYEQKIKKLKSKYAEQEKNKVNNESKIYSLIQQNQQLKCENNKVLDVVQQEKKKNLNIIKAYQDKMLEYYNNFSEFKREFYLSLKQELTAIKVQLGQMANSAKQQKIRFQQMMCDYAKKITRQIQIINHKHQLQIEKVRNEYEYEKILKIEEEKREIKMQCDMKMKQQSIQFYTIMAQKQHQINNLTEKQARLIKKLNEIEEKNTQIDKIAKQTNKNNQELKEIISKMNSKVAQSERNYSSTQNELQFYRKSNIELKKQINQLEASFKEKIEECRQKYSTQNERLFAKYQKEFSKFIVSNKKSLEFSMLSNSCSNIHVPTKGVPTEGKLDKIQRQIEEQKKKLNILEKGMESKIKFEKTSKITVERDNPRSQKSKKY